jgi:hypothetical protein
MIVAVCANCVSGGFFCFGGVAVFALKAGHSYLRAHCMHQLPAHGPVPVAVMDSDASHHDTTLKHDWIMRGGLNTCIKHRASTKAVSLVQIYLLPGMGITV